MPFHEFEEPLAMSRIPSGRLTPGRRRPLRGAILAVFSLVGALLMPAVASAGTAAITFTDPGEHAFGVPQGLVGSLHIDAIGAAGQEPEAFRGFGTQGGVGAQVAGNLAIVSGVLYAEVGVGGGGVHGLAYPGGGASDVRRCPAAASFCPGAGSSLQSRVLVAGGGGGANFFGDGGAAYDGFARVLAPQSAVAGGSGTGTLSLGGRGGGGGGATAGGAGGAGAAAAGAGAPGGLGQGGQGGYDGVRTSGTGSGGGGGYFGGGGGGQGSDPTGLDGGGGGGGSSYVGTIGSATIATATLREPRVTITYSENEPPALTLQAPAPSNAATFTGTAGRDTGDEPAVTVTVRAGSGTGGLRVVSLTTTRDASTGAYAVTPPSALPPGTYTAEATQADAAGNSATTQPVTFTIAGDSPSSPAGPAPGQGATSPGPGSTPTPAPPATGAPRARRASAALRISNVAPRRCRRGGRCAGRGLVVSGRAARSTVGTIALTVRQGRRDVRRVVVPIRAGRWTASIVAPVGKSWRLTIIATFRGDAGHLPATARRSVVLRPSS
jgi:hypothetical protein